MCHPVIEKALKAVVSDTGSTPPYTHNLSKLAELCGVYGKLDDGQMDLIDALEPLNVQARYPEEKDRILHALNSDRCRTLLVQTEGPYRWIRATL